MTRLETIPRPDEAGPGSDDTRSALTPTPALSVLDKIRARYAAVHELPTTLDVDVPGQEGLGVRYRVLDPEELASIRLGDLNGDATALMDACECIVFRESRDEEWQPLLVNGMRVGFELSLAAELGLDVDPDGEQLDVLHALFGLVPQPHLAVSDHAAALIRWMGRPRTVDEAAALGESSPSPK